MMMINLKKWTAIMFVLATGLMLVNCGGTPGTNPVKDAQNAYDGIKEDTMVVNHAPGELEKAKEALQEARQSMSQDSNQSEANNKALIAQQRVKIAKNKAQVDVTRGQLQQAQNKLQALLDQQRQMKNADATADEWAKQLTYFSARQTKRGLVLRFKNIKFGSESASLKSSAEPPINELTEFLNKYPERRVAIEGYTDATGAKSYNQKLSQQRANIIRDALISRGIAGSRLKAVGMGEKYPVASNQTKIGRRQNRRVDVVVSNKDGTIPDRQ